jgi:hypothetical protein
LGIEHIAAYSPQARGRSERLFQTLQDRVPKELVLAGITTVEAANAWLRDTYIPAHNARFAVKAEQEGSQGNRIRNLLDGRRWQLPGSGRIDSTPCGLVTTGGDDGRLHSLL